MDAQTVNDGEVHESSEVAELVIGGLVMLVALGLFVDAFQSAANDGPYTASAWLIALALSFVGVFVWSHGIRKQRIAAETEQEKSDAETVAKQAIERVRKRSDGEQSEDPGMDELDLIKAILPEVAKAAYDDAVARFEGNRKDRPGSRQDTSIGAFFFSIHGNVTRSVGQASPQVHRASS